MALFAEDFSVPVLTSPVMDLAKIVDDETELELNSYIQKVYEQTGVQLAVLTLHSLGGVPIEEVSIQTVEKWQLGQKEKDNGVLLTVAYEDRELRIEVGYGLEGVLTDAESSRIIRNEITPFFKNGNYTKGIVNGVLKITEIATEGAQIETELAKSEKNSEWTVADIIAISWFIFIFLLIVTTSTGIGPLGWYFWVSLFTGKPFKRHIPERTHFDDDQHHFGSGRGGFSGGSRGGRSGRSGGGFHGGGGRFGGGGSSGRW